MNYRAAALPFATCFVAGLAPVWSVMPTFDSLFVSFCLKHLSSFSAELHVEINFQIKNIRLMLSALSMKLF